MAGLGTAVLAANWQGPDADSVRETWSRHAAPGIEVAAARLRNRGDELGAHAEDQDAASAAETLGAPGQPLRPLSHPSLSRGAPGPLAARLGALFGRLGAPPSGTAMGPGVLDLFSGSEASQEISGIAPGGPDPLDDAWKWLLGEDEETSPLPLPPEGPGPEKDAPQTGDPVDIDLGDWELGGEDESTTAPTEPTKPANWPADMPWPPNSRAPVGDDGQYVYGSEGYGDPGDAANDDRPVGTRVDEGGAVGAAGDNGYVEGTWVFSEGTNVTEDEHGNHTFTIGTRGGAEVEGGVGTDAGTGVVGTGTAEGYVEGGATVGRDGYGVGWRAGAEVTGQGSYAQVNDDGSSTIYTVEASAEAGAHASHYGHRVRNAEGESTGWASGFDVGAGATAGYSYTEEHISPHGWFQHSTTVSDSAGESAGAAVNTVVSTDEISISADWSIPFVDEKPFSSADTGPLSGVSFAIDPNQIVSDLSGGAFDADDIVHQTNRFSPYHNPLMPAWA